MNKSKDQDPTAFSALCQTLVFKRIPRAGSGTSDSKKSRKSHKKSRGGCRHCKLRRVKCDELRPKCGYCISKDTPCVYNALRSDVLAPREILADNRFRDRPDPFLEILCAPDVMATTLINDHLAQQCSPYPTNSKTITHFSKADLLRLHHFQRSTSRTVGRRVLQDFVQNEVVKRAVHFPYLLHAVLVSAAMHMRNLESPSSVPSNDELHHWQQTLTLFANKLSSGINEVNSDAMLVTSSLISGVAFAMVWEHNPELAWPFGDPVDDLQWINIGSGIETMLSLAEHASPSSIVKQVYREEEDGMTPTGEDEILKQLAGTKISITSRLARLCDIRDDSMEETNPYLKPLRRLAWLLPKTCTAETVLSHLGFISILRPDFVELIHARDHRALLLLGYWYATMCPLTTWWTFSRSMISCKAICMYLEKYADSTIVDLLPHPARACGYTLDSKIGTPSTDASQTLIPCQTM